MPSPFPQSEPSLTSNAADAFDNGVNHLLADRVVTAGIVVGSILLSADQELGVEKLSVVAGADFINWGGVEIDKDGSGNVFAVACLGEKGIVRATVGEVLRVGVWATILAEAVLEEVPDGSC